MQPLPIDALLPEVVASLRDTPRLVVEAPPGAGKTTRLPPALLDAGLAGAGEILVLEPRRIAARLAARRVADERGEELGETIGYQVRFESVGGARTRLKYVTEGILLRRLLNDPQLPKVSVVILDEFHERHLESDLALALLKRLQQQTRPDLRLVVMSATLDAAPVARFLGACPTLRSEGRRFEVEIEHLASPDERPVAVQVQAAMRRLLGEGLDGDALVFLPGAAEIRRAAEACAPLAAEFDLSVLPLHGELSPAEQDRAVRPADRRKLILSTNVAESSVTIPGVVAVVDAGLARVAEHSQWSGLPTFSVTRISRASATQRAGRAGRTRPGRALRLYTAQDFNARAEYETPEILRADLTEATLELHAAGVGDLHNFEWFEPPPARALEQAETLLRGLGALDGGRKVTVAGRRMLQLPLHPRLARVLIEAGSRGVAAAACVVAALLSERDIRARQLLSGSRESRFAQPASHGKSDLLTLFDLFAEAASKNFAAEVSRRLNLDPRALQRVERVRRQLERLLGVKGETLKTSADTEAELLISILAGYPDRVARRRSFPGKTAGDNYELLLSGGGAATLAPESLVRAEEFLVAVDAEERRGVRAGATRGASTVVRLASAIEPEWLIDLFAENIRETTDLEWNAQLERVETVTRLTYEGITLDESRASAPGAAGVAAVLAEAVLAAGYETLFERETLERFLARVEFIGRTFPEADFPSLGEEDVRASVVALCEGRRSLAEVRAAARGDGLLRVLGTRLTSEQSRMLAKLAPERVTLARGRQVRVNYERDKPPWIASRLQDFFGMKDAPPVAGGRVPLVLQLLAPNQRAVQITTDLSGFWSRHYPQVRRELSRRYPRHNWPENPLAPPTEKSDRQR
ncbi:MAG: ATP-dependent helicase HrpB [Pyrinomonadaceae bacterium]|jgi:ATP-dependent helicase HrpB|nr:ATP-dependent helicase HrpB [Pyrinomonadaceae bacterium]